MTRMPASAVLAAAILITPVSVVAAGSEPAAGSPTRADPDYQKARQAIDAKDWETAIELLNRVAGRNDSDANLYSWLGYAERQRGNYPQAFSYYDKALALDPKHRGAHEYIGEAYLLMGNLAKAEEHLAALDQLCFFSCSEYRELKEQVARFKQQTK